MTLRKLYQRFAAVPTNNSEAATRCSSCGARTKSHERLAFTGEHLRCHVKRLQASGAANAIDVSRERRRHARHRAAWSLRVRFGDLGFAAARAKNVSLSGIGLAVMSASAAALLTPGRDVDVEAYDEGELVFRAGATVRHRTGSTAGLEWATLLPESVLPRATA